MLGNVGEHHHLDLHGMILLLRVNFSFNTRQQDIEEALVAMPSCGVS